MRQIDIALDCFPHNSGTTLIEHLYMGNPFITYSNRPSVGKIGASILTSLGHPEWIATSEEEYVEKAVALASDPKNYPPFARTLEQKWKPPHSWIIKVLFVNSKQLIKPCGKIIIKPIVFI